MKKRLWILCLILCGNKMSAQEVFDLKKCIEIGLAQNYEIRIVRNEQSISDNNKTIGNAGYLPQLDLQAGYSGTINNTEQQFATGEQSNLNGIHNQNVNAGLSLNWTVFDGFKMQASYNKMKELQQKGELRTRLTIEYFIASISSEYYNYIQQKIRLSNFEHALKLSKERLRIVQSRYQIGSSSNLEWQQAKVDFNTDSSKLIKQHEVVYASQIQLNKLLALDNIEQQFFAKDSQITYNSLINKDELWTQILHANALLLLAQKEKNISALELQTLKSQNYPYLKLNAGYGYSLNSYEVGAYSQQQNIGLNYGLSIGFNIFDGQKRTQQKNRTIALKNAALDIENLQLYLKAELANKWMAYTNNMQLTNLEKENLQTAQESYDIAMARYKLGNLSGFELREIQNNVLAAEERLVQAQYATKLCEIFLLQMSGQLSLYIE